MGREVEPVILVQLTPVGLIKKRRLNNESFLVFIVYNHVCILAPYGNNDCPLALLLSETVASSLPSYAHVQTVCALACALLFCF